MTETTAQRSQRVADEIDAALDGQLAALVTETVRPRLTELAAIGRPGTVRASARAGSKAHLTDLTHRQLDVLQMADNPSGGVSANGSTGVTRPTIKALDAKGYGRAVYDMRRKHLVIGFEINDAGRRAVRAARGWPTWAGPHTYLANADRTCYQNVERPSGFVQACGEPANSPIHTGIDNRPPASAGCPHGTRRWADDTHVHPFSD